MKKVKIFSLLAALVVLLCACGETPKKIEVKTAEDSADSLMLKLETGFCDVLQNDRYVLSVRPETAEIALRDCQSGAVVYSNPQDRAEDTVALGESRSLLDSQLSLEYSDASDSFSTLYSAEDAVALGQVHYGSADGEFAVLYEFGERAQTYLAPLALEPETMEHILEQVEDEDRDTLESVYTYLDLSEISDEYVRQQILETFPTLKDEPMYIISNYTSEISEFVQEMIADVLEKTDYDLKQMQADAKRLKLANAAEAAKPAFNITLRYTLTENGLCATVRAADIVYDTSAFRLTKLTVLPYFGAVRLGSRDAYALIPDGSGALLAADEKMPGTETYCKPVYGRDLALEQTQILPEIAVRLPVWGLKNGQNALFAEITAADAVANLCADGTGGNDSYLKAYAQFSLTPYVHPQYSALNIWTVNSYQERICSSDVSLCYCILNGDEANYVGMANTYRRRLSAGKDAVQSDALILSLLGAVEYPDSAMGFRVRKKAVLTTYGQAAEIVEKVQSGIDGSVSVIMEGATNRGIYTDADKAPKAVSALGGKKELQRLALLCKNGFALNGDLWHTLSKKRNRVAVTVNGNSAYAYRYRLNDYTRVKLWEDYFAVSPRVLPDYGKIYRKGTASLALCDSALLSLGDVLYSDFSKSDLCDRTQAETKVRTVLADCAAAGKVTVSGGNSYALSAASTVVEAPITTAKQYGFSASVPFYAIATRGVVTAAATPMNVPDNRTVLLTAIETGTNLFVRWMYADNSVLKKTYFDGDSYCYEPWLESVCNSYNEWHRAVGDCVGKAIIAHENVGDTLTKTTFEGGKTVYVNYGDADQTADGVSVAAMNWVIA